MQLEFRSAYHLKVNKHKITTEKKKKKKEKKTRMNCHKEKEYNRMKSHTTSDQVIDDKYVFSFGISFFDCHYTTIAISYLKVSEKNNGETKKKVQSMEQPSMGQPISGTKKQKENGQIKVEKNKRQESKQINKVKQKNQVTPLNKLCIRTL
jgi:hypothetical protein